MMKSKIEGTWQAVAAEMAGQPLPPAVVVTLLLTVTGDRYQIRNDSGQLVFLPGDKLEIKGEEGPNKGKVIPAIWKFADGELCICYNLTGPQWPKTFDSKSGYFLTRYVKP